MNAKIFFKGLSWLIILNLLIKPVWIFGIDRQVQNVVGHETYGVYFSLLNLSIILAIIADAGLTNMYNRQLALGAPPDFRKLLNTKFILAAAFLGVFFLVCLLTGIGITTTVILMGCLQVLTSFLLFFRSIITGNQLFKQDAFISVADKILMIIICGAMFLLPHLPDMTLNRFLYIQCFCTLAAILLAWKISSRIPSVQNTTAGLRSIIRLTYPFILLIALMSLHTRLDAFLLERLHSNGDYEAGIYAAAYRLLDAGNMVGYLAASFIVPFVARHLNEKKVIDNTVLKLLHALMIIAIGAVIVIAGFAPEIIELLYHDYNYYNAIVLSLCIAVLPAYYLIHLYGSLLTAKGQFKTFATIVSVSVLLNIGLNLFFIEKYGAEGCCVAALISQYILAITCGISANRSFQLAASRRWMIVYLLAVIILAWIVWLFPRQDIQLY